MNDQTNTDEILCRGGRTGRKVHSAHAKSSSTRCGHWLKTHASRFRVSALTADAVERAGKNLCQSCFPNPETTVRVLREREVQS